jgi:hypothetical protein
MEKIKTGYISKQISLAQASESLSKSGSFSPIAKVGSIEEL